MIEAYLDETGIHEGAAFCVIAGYFGGRGQWDKSARDWRRSLRDFNVPLEEFHALDFIKGRKFFSGWSRDGRREALLKRLTDAVTRYKLYPVTTSLNIADFCALTEVQRRFFTGATVLNGKLITSGCPNKPYFVPFQRCTKRVVSYAQVGGEAHFFFGLDRPFSKYAATLYGIIKNGKQPDKTRARLGDISFPRASETPQLQAADLLAYLTAEHMRLLNGRTAPPNPELEALLKNTRMPDDHEYLTQETFRDSIATLLPIAPVLAFDHEEEEELPK